MAIGDDEWKNISSLLSNPREANLLGDALSPEDAAWIDSCFVKDDSKLSDESWNSLKDAIWDIISETATHIDGPSNGKSGVFREEDDDRSSNDEDEETKPLPPSACVRNDFLLNPYYSEKNGDGNAEVAVDFLEDTESPENIFRVWDLEIPFEEDELLNQLNKAITESSLRDVPPTLGDSVSNEQDLDELIAGIADLSLHPSL